MRYLFTATLEDFIDNDDPTPGGSNLAPPHSDPVAANDEAGMWDELLARAYQRGHEHVQHPSASLDAVAVPSLPVFGARLPTEPEEPNDEDYPLWRVRCRVSPRFSPLFKSKSLMQIYRLGSRNKQ